jgi:hypothetical protein
MYPPGPPAQQFGNHGRKKKKKREEKKIILCLSIRIIERDASRADLASIETIWAQS